MHLIANNTGLISLGQNGAFPESASFTLASMARCLGDDRRRLWGPALGLLAAETFVGSAMLEGRCYHAAKRRMLGKTKGCAHSSGNYTARHGKAPSKSGFCPCVARRLLADPDAGIERFAKRNGKSKRTEGSWAMRALYEECERLPGQRRCLGSGLINQAKTIR